jgi:hypothetical protein
VPEWHLMAPSAFQIKLARAVVKFAVLNEIERMGASKMENDLMELQKRK